MSKDGKPSEGSVIRYSFLWKHEFDLGIIEGKKDRPCVVVVVSEGGRILLAPITHSPPKGSTGIDVPQDIKRRLGLDETRSWVIASELNMFTWPGFDIRTVPGKTPKTFVYGVLPRGYLFQIRTEIFNLAKKRLTATVDRNDGLS
jgi:hypothetical protein